MTMIKKSRVDSAVTPCVMLTRDGAACGKPGQVGLPVGICGEHAVAIYRAVSRLVAEQAKAS